MAANSAGPHGWIQMKALGRPFRIGTLYNYHQDEIVPGTLLWDPDDVRDRVDKEAIKKWKAEIHEADHHQGKTAALGIDDHLMMSLMGAMIDDYRGASKYIDDRYEVNQAGACFHGRSIDRQERIEPAKMKGFDLLCKNQVLRQGTHVVVAVTYGAECFCVARQPIGENETKEDVHQRLRDWFEHWRGCLEDELPSYETPLDQVTCRLYTDLPLARAAASCQDCYANCLQVKAATERSAVPLTVRLCPLRQVTTMAPRQLSDREISRDVVTPICQLWHQFNSIDQMLDELVSGTSDRSVPFGDRVKSLRRSVRKYRQLADSRLGEVIGRVRRGAEGEAAIEQVVALIRQSAFDPERLLRWITLKRTEVAALRMVASTPEARLIFDRDALVASARQYCLVLRLPNLHCENVEEIDQMRLYVERNPQLVQWGAPLAADIPTRPVEINWLRSDVFRFCRFAAENAATATVEYFVLYDGRYQSASGNLELHQKGDVVADGIQLPQAPHRLRVAENHRATVTLRWDVGHVLLLKHFVVEYREDGGKDWNRVTGTDAGSLKLLKLKPRVAYWFRVASVHAFGRSEFSAPIGPETVRAICDAPASITLRYATESMLSIAWKGPVVDDDIRIEQYLIRYWPAVKPSNLIEVATGSTVFKLGNLQRSTAYMIQLIADCGRLGIGAASEPISMETNDRPEPAASIIRDYVHESVRQNIHFQEDGLEILHLPIRETMLGKEKMIRNCQLGHGVNRFVRKTILVVGATGAGKTTLINGMINYILGVNFDDEFRFKLVREPPKTQAVSQTEHVTAYDIFRMRGANLDYSLTIVDTPGFGDTRGLERDRMIMEQVRSYFESVDGVQELEAVCFLLQASLARLTPTQRYIYDSILSLFGKDIRDNIRLMVTFADNQVPPVLDAVLESDIPYPLDANGKPLHHKFNNSCVFKAASAGDDEVFTKMFYQMGTRNFGQFFAELGRMKTTSLTLTKEVLLERKRLEVVVEGLQQRIQHGLNQIEEFKQIRKALADNEQQIFANKNFNFQVEFSVQEAKDISGTGNYTTNCDTCKWTCHYPCKHANDADRRHCLAMDADGNCRVCPGKCPSTSHFNQKLRYEWVKKKVDRSSDKIRKEYEDAQNKQLTNKELIEQLAKDLKAHESSIMELVNVTYPIIERLNEIALKPHPFSAPEYIDLIIKAEQQEHRDGYLHRIETLRQLRQTAEIQHKMINKEKVFDAAAAKPP